jgi:hypothetical protein
MSAISTLRPSSHKHVGLFDFVRHFLDKILLNRALREVKERGLVRNEQFGFGPRHSTAAQLLHSLEKVNRNFDGKRITAAVFLVVAKDFYTEWVKYTCYRIILLNFPSYLVKRYPRTMTVEHFTYFATQPNLHVVS